MENHTNDNEKIRKVSIIQGLRQTIQALEMTLSSLESEFRKDFPAEGLSANDPAKPFTTKGARELRDFL